MIALAQAGFGEAVAPLGTALTEGQLERLWRLVEVAHALLRRRFGGPEGRDPGRALRALPMIEPGRTLRFVTLPAGWIPDDLVRSGGVAAMEALLESRRAAGRPTVEAAKLAAGPASTRPRRARACSGWPIMPARSAMATCAANISLNSAARFDALYERGARLRPRFQPRPGGGPASFPRQAPPELPAARPQGAIRSARARALDPMMGRAVLAGLYRHPR